MENIINITLNRFLLTKYRIDSCIDKSNPKTIITTEPIVNGIIENNTRGIKSRVITEVTQDNILYCRELMKLSIELRHMDDIKGNFSISDGEMYQATAMGDFSVASRLDNNHDSTTSKEREEERLQPITTAGIETETILSNVRAFVSQQQYFFDTLWKKAIPAKQRIKEIEEGAKREFIDTIQEPVEIEKLLFQLLKSAAEEILIINSAGSSFLLSKLDGIMQLLSEAAVRAVSIRILIDREDEDDSLRELVQELRSGLEQEGKGEVRQQQQNQKHHRIHIQYLNKPKYSKVTTIVVDNEFSIAIEIKDDDNNNKNKSFGQSIGLATYSNSQSTVLSYASIFETLWVQAELKPTNMR